MIVQQGFFVAIQVTADRRKTDALIQRRSHVVPEDVQACGRDVLRHRILVTYEAEAERLTSDDIVTSLFAGIEVP